MVLALLFVLVLITACLGVICIFGSGIADPSEKSDYAFLAGCALLVAALVTAGAIGAILGGA